MKTSLKYLLPELAVVLALCAGSAIAADSPPANTQTSAVVTSIFDSLLGKWVRPDGGYTITIKSVDSDGALDATYANPNPLPFSQAQASLDGDAITVFLELSAGGYNGSTYKLSYDPATDTLQGIYYQAVAQQEFAVYFEHTK